VPIGPSITHTTTGATGIGAATGLPPGVTASWATNTITISGTPTASGTFSYSIPLTGGCGTVSATGTITVRAVNTVSVASSTPSLCINTSLTPAVTHTTTGATGIGVAIGLPAGVTASWASNIITISGTPTASGTFTYSIPLTGGCGTVNATGTITVRATNTVSAASSTPTLCINTLLAPSVTHTTAGATGIGAATGLPPGVTASWASNTITISGTPTASGTFTYSIPLTGGCGTVNATGTITVFPSFTFNPLSDTTRVCGTSTTLNAGPGFASYSWNTTATIQTIPATASGFYKVTVTNAAGCTASDSTYLSLVNANIINNDTTICKGSSITLSIDSLFPGRTVCNANQLPASLRNGLVGYWPFCGNANDESGNGNNGVVNGATLTTDRLGSANSAYSFDGVNDFIQMPNRSISGSFTISCWYKMPTYNINTLGANDFIFFANHSGVNDNNRNVLVGYRNFGSEYGHSTYVKGGSGNMIGYYALNQIPVANKWHHFVCQFTNGVSVKMYLDNVLFYTNNTVVSNTTLPSLPMFFGIGIPTQFNFYKGELDDVSIWNRVLTEQEILQLYNSTSSVTWSPTGATTNSITVSPTQTTTYYVTVTDGITTCTDSVKVTVSTVDTSLTVLDPLQLCATGGQVRMQAGVASSYQWLLNGSPIVNATLQTYSATQSGVYRVVVTNSLNCRDTSRAVTITVNPTPTVNSVNNTTVCSGATVSSITFSGSVAGTVYSWSNNTPSIGLATSGTGNLPTFTAVNTTTAPVTATITVTPSFTNGGLTCTGTPTTFTITVNPLPTVAAVTNQIICNGATTTAIAFNGTIPGTVFNWTNNTPSVGLAASGTGNIASFVTTNTVTTPVTATITVTPSITTGGITCTGTPQTFTITVNPIPTVAVVSNQTICSGSTVAGITFSGNIPGTVFSWTNNTTSIGLAASGTGNIVSFTPINNTNAPVTATITVTPSFTNGGLTCTGTPRTFTITVNPNPSALINPNAQTICSGAALTPISISGPVAGTIFTWTRDNASTVTGVSASGTGDINGSLTNTTNAPILVTFTITPAFTNAGVTCTGTAITSVVLVNPLPTVNSTPNAQTICSGNAITPINMTGVVTGTVYSWTRDNTTTITGIGASGTGNISGSLTNTTNTPITVTFTFTPTANGCVGIPSVARVLVNPAPTMIATPSNQAICSGGTINPIVMTGGVIGTVFNWTRDNVSSVPGIPANGAGNISGTLTNNSAVPVLVTFTITPTANACQGAATTATVLVNPKPTGTITSSSTIICEGSSVTLTATGGSTYQWFLDGQPVSGATGATLNAVQAGTYTVQLISSAGCTTQVTNSITLTSIARPTAAFTFDKYCAGVSTQFTDLSTIAASGSVTYAWNFGPGATSTLQNPQYTFTTPGAYLVSLTVTPTACPSLTSVATRLVQVQSAPANQRYPSVNAVEGRGLRLQARVITNATYNWSPSQGLNRVDIRTPIFNYNQEQQYLITILLPEGCVIRDTLLVRLFKQVDILLPTGFSPNGDGHNDQLIPRLVGIDKLKYFRVYDRWGQLLFQTDQIGKGWDGTFKGVKQPLETYAWVAEGVAVDGSVIKRSGTSILLR
jgi:gliding motility-associated-like protein